MTDSNLSQDEINALLEGSEQNITQEAKVFIQSFENDLSSFKDQLSELIGKPCQISQAKANVSDPDTIFQNTEDNLIEINAAFTGENQGEHNYYLPSSKINVLAGPMIGQEDVEINDTTLSAVSEIFSQMSSQLVNNFSKSNIDLNVAPPQATEKQKTDINLTSPQLSLTYTVTVDEETIDIIETFSLNIPEKIGQLISQNSNQQSTNKTQNNNKNSNTLRSVQFPEFNVDKMNIQEQQNLGLLMDVPMVVTVELGRTKWQLREILTMGEGTIVELEKQAGEPVDVLVNNNLIARGEVVVVEENFSVRITEIISGMEQMLQKTD